MPENRIDVLGVEDNPGDARLVQEMLKEAGSGLFSLTNVSRIDDAVRLLKEKRFDIVLLDLNLPDCQGLEGLESIVAAEPRVPIVVLTGLDSEATGVRAIEKRASDYLVKGEITASLLVRSIRYSIERKKAEDRIREGEERYRRIVETANEGILATDAERKTIFVNQRMADMLGYTVDEMTGRSASGFLAPGQEQLVSRTLGELRAGTRTEREFKLIRKDGSELWAISNATPVLGAEGRHSGTVSMLTDITERKRAEEALKVERGRLAAIIENTPAGIALTDAKGGTVHSNAAFDGVWGAGRPEVVRVEDYEKFQGWWTETGIPLEPEDWASAVVLRTGKPCLGQNVKIRRFDGTFAFVQNSAAPVLGEKGEVIGTVVAIVDITERIRAEQELRESERRWRDLADAMPQMVWTSDGEGRCDFLSRQWLEYTGLQETDQLGLGWLDSIHPDDRQRLMEGWNESTHAGLRFEGEFRIKRHDGAYRWFKTSAVAVRDARNRVIKWYGSNTDIESIKRTEENLGEANKRLEILASAAGKLLASKEPQKIVVELASMIMTLAGCDTFFNFLADEDSQRLHLNAYAGVPASDARRVEWLDYGVAVCGVVAQEGHRIVLESIQRTDDPRADFVRSFGIKAFACHPLLSGDRVLGTLAFGSHSSDRFSREDLALMKAVSDYVAIALGRLKAEDALREKEKDLNRAQAVARAGSWRMDVQRNELMWSDENHRIFGISKGPPLTYETFLSTIHPDDRDFVDERWQAALSGEAYDIEHRIVVDGAVRWVRERAEIEFNSAGDLLGGFGTTQDITERKQVEEEIERSRLWLERIAGTTPDIIFVLDILNDRKVYANRSVIDLLGYSQEEFGGIEDILKKVIEPEDREQVAKFYRGMADARKGEVRVLTIRARHKNGRMLWLENRATPFSWDEEGNLAEVIAISHDITDLKLAHEVLQRDRETFERLVNERTAELVEIHNELDKARHLSDIGMLASTVAHELRNPLGVIKTAAYNINRKKQGSALDKHLETINRKIDESNQIINNLLMYSRIKQPAYEAVRIRDLLRESVESARARNDGRSVTLLDECDPVKNVTATLDPLQIAEVMSNILANAAQAIPVENAGSVTVSARVEGGMLRIGVRDTGVGIDPDMLPRVFDPFFTSKSKGTGLGLSLCRELVALHNGSIEIESELGKGTTVTVNLPLSPEIRPSLA